MLASRTFAETFRSSPSRKLYASCVRAFQCWIFDENDAKWASDVASGVVSAVKGMDKLSHLFLSWKPDKVGFEPGVDALRAAAQISTLESVLLRHVNIESDALGRGLASWTGLRSLSLDYNASEPDLPGRLAEAMPTGLEKLTLTGKAAEMGPADVELLFSKLGDLTHLTLRAAHTVECAEAIGRQIGTASKLTTLELNAKESVQRLDVILDGLSTTTLETLVLNSFEITAVSAIALRRVFTANPKLKRMSLKDCHFHVRRLCLFFCPSGFAISDFSCRSTRQATSSNQLSWPAKKVCDTFHSPTATSTPLSQYSPSPCRRSPSSSSLPTISSTGCLSCTS